MGLRNCVDKLLAISREFEDDDKGIVRQAILGDSHSSVQVDGPLTPSPLNGQWLSICVKCGDSVLLGIK